MCKKLFRAFFKKISEMSNQQTKQKKIRSLSSYSPKNWESKFLDFITVLGEQYSNSPYLPYTVIYEMSLKNSVPLHPWLVMCELW